MNKPAAFQDSESFKVLFKADEFIRLLFSDVFEDARLELIDGELFHMSPPSGGHASKQAAVIGPLWRIARDAGLHVLGEVAVRVSDCAVLVCDAALVRRLPRDRSAISPADVLLVIEVAETTSSRDLGYKQVAYAAAAIPTYWVIEGTSGLVHVFSKPTETGYARHDELALGEPLAVPGTDATITID